MGDAREPAASANRAPIAQQESDKMAQAIFEVLEGGNVFLLTASPQRESNLNVYLNQPQYTGSMLMHRRLTTNRVNPLI